MIRGSAENTTKKTQMRNTSDGSAIIDGKRQNVSRRVRVLSWRVRVLSRRVRVLSRRVLVRPAANGVLIGDAGSGRRSTVGVSRILSSNRIWFSKSF